MATKPFIKLKEDFLFEVDFVTNIGSKVFVYPFIDRSKNALRCYTTLCVLLFMTTAQLTVSLIDLKLESWFDIINIAPNLGVCVLILVKYTKMQSSRKVYGRILKHFKNDLWDVINPESDKHKAVLETYTNVCRIIVRFEYYYAIVLVSIVILFPRILMFVDSEILGNDIMHLYPFDGWYPFDKVKWYNTAYVWESIMTAIVIVLFVFANMIHISLTRYICMEIKILGTTMEDLISREDVVNITKRKHVEETNARIKAKLKFIIQRHQVLASIVSDLEGVLGMGMLLVYIFGSVFICLTIFTASVCYVVDDLYMSLRYFSFFCSLLVEVFIQCIIGQLLIDHSAILEQAIYFTDWPHADRDTKRMLLIFLIRAQRPLKFSAKGYLIMNLDTFCRVCSFSYQFFSLLRTAYVQD